MAFAGLAALSVTAQNNIFNNPDNKAYFGIRVGGEITCPGKITAGSVGLDVYKNGGFSNDLRVSVFTGPEFEVGFTAKEHIKGLDASESYSIYGDDGGMKRFDMLWGFGAGVTYQHLYFGVSGGIGLINKHSGSHHDDFRSVFYVTVY